MSTRMSVPYLTNDLNTQQELKIQNIQLENQSQILKLKRRKVRGSGIEIHLIIVKKFYLSNSPWNMIEIILSTLPFWNLRRSYLKNFSWIGPNTQDLGFFTLRSKIDEALGSGYNSEGQFSPPRVCIQQQS